MPFWAPTIIPSWLINGTTVVPVSYPDGAGVANPTFGANPWVYGNYVDIVAANVLTAYTLDWLCAFSSDYENLQIQIATGAAGFEIVIATLSFRWWNLSGAGVSPAIGHPFPAGLQIPANARVAVRARGSIGGKDAAVYCTFYPRPK